MFTTIYPNRKVLSSLILYEKLKSFRKVGRILGIGKSTIHRWYKTFHSSVRISQHKITKKQRKKKYPCLIEQIKEIFAGKSKVELTTLIDIQNQLNEKFRVKPHIGTIFKALKKAKISRKRFSSMTKVANENNVKLKSNIFYKNIQNVKNDEIVCLDEIGFSSHGNAFYGYFRRGEKPLKQVIKKRSKYSCIAAVSTKGIITLEIQKSAYNAEGFINFVTKTLLPAIPNGTKYILMDNVSFHHNKKVVEILKNHKLETLYIPPYSPQYNPIEEVFAFVKHNFRKLSLSTNVFGKECVEAAFQKLKVFKDLTKYYNHSRRAWELRF